MPGAAAVTIAGGGHFLPLDKPDAVISHLKNFAGHAIQNVGISFRSGHKADIVAMSGVAGRAPVAALGRLERHSSLTHLWPTKARNKIPSIVEQCCGGEEVCVATRLAHRGWTRMA